MISDEYKCIFIHIPRVGGSSIELALTGLDWWNSFHIPGVLIAREQAESGTNLVLNEYNDVIKILMDYQPKHLSVEETRLYHSNLWSTYFKFAFVRNPWDRLVSIYKCLESVLVGCKPQNSSWQVLVVSCFKDRGYLTENFEMVCFSKFVHRFRPMPWETNHKSQAGFLRGSASHEKLDFIGRFERFDEDFDLVCDKLHIPSLKLPKENSSDRGHYKDYYDLATRDFVAQAYAEDINSFNYTF